MLVVTATALSGAVTVAAQVSEGGTPPSFGKAVGAAIDRYVTAPIDVAALLEEDARTPKDVPFRFGYPFDVRLGLDNAGTWEVLADGSRLWRLQIECPGAASINLIFDRFWLPDGARLFIYNADRSHVIGAFTSRNNKDYGSFATQPVRGDVSVLEYWEPAGLNAQPELRVSRIVHAYRNLFARDFLKDFGESGACNNNVRCPEWAAFDPLIRSVALITTGGGFRLCSGAMINNVRQDLTPYFLTANHCLGGSDTWVFIFNYESPACSNVDGPTYMTVSGSTLRANLAYSDFALLELSEQPPDSYNVYYAGWNAVNAAADSVIAIHHPSGDIKKITFDYNAVTSTSYLGTAVPGDDSHWRIGQWEDGTTEPGSSGSPIFNRQGQIIGQLHGGYASCASITSDWYGKFAKSWSYGSTAATRLRDWLDPDNTGALSLGGRESAGISITHDPLPDTRDTVNDYAVLAAITSDVPLDPDSLLLYYEIGAANYEDTLTPTGNPDEFVGYIPAQAPGTVVSYRLLAVDSDGKADTTDSFSFRVIDYGLTLAPAADTLSGPVADSVWYALQIVNTGVYTDSYALAVSGNAWTTEIFDAAGTTPLLSTGPLAADSVFAFTVRVIVPPSVYGAADTALVTATSVGDPVYTAASRLRTVSDGEPLAIPFEDEFPAAALSAAHWVQTTGAEANAVALAEPSEPYSLNLDGAPAGADTVMSQVINLAGQGNLIVRYFYERTGGGDSPEANDDLFVEYRDSAGVWQLLQQHLGSGPDMTTFSEVELPLPPAAYHSAFRLRLRSIGTAGAYDDWFVDDLYVGPPQPFKLSLDPAFASQYGPAGDTMQYTLQIANRGSQADQYSFADSGGAWPVLFWDDAGVAPVGGSGMIAAGDSARFVVKVEVPADAPMNAVDSCRVRAVSAGDPLMFDDSRLVSFSAGPPGGFPWYEPFPVDTVIVSRWTSIVGAAVSAAALFPPSAPYAAALDGGVDTLTSQPIDLSGRSDVVLSYYYERGGSSEPPDAGDDLWVEYKNNSGSWVLVARHLGSGAPMSSFERVTFGLPADALHGGFQVRFRSFGSGADSDFWFVDNISVDYAPALAVAPSGFSAGLVQGDSAADRLLIANTGLGVLTYSLSVVPVAAKGNTRLGELLASGELAPAHRRLAEGFEDYADHKGADDPRSGPAVEKSAGGPDGHGYFWIDSDESGGPAFEWIDVSAAGTDVISALNDDNFAGPYAIGFPFPFYDSAYTEIYIGSNGIIGFAPGAMNSRFKKHIPNDTLPNALLAWLWDDLNPDDVNNAAAAHVYLDTSGGRCVIQFTAYPEYLANPGDVITAEVILEPDGSIRFQYLSVAAGFDAAGGTIGIESPDGTDGLEVAYLTPYLKDSLCIRFVQPYQWLGLSRFSGTVAAGGTDTVGLMFRSAGLDSGLYQAALVVSCNDPNHPAETVPAELTVTLQPAWICGDINGDGAGPSVADLTFFINFLFRGGPAPPDPAACDFDGSGDIALPDLTQLINFLFRGGSPPTCGN